MQAYEPFFFAACLTVRNVPILIHPVRLTGASHIVLVCKERRVRWGGGVHVALRLR